MIFIMIFMEIQNKMRVFINHLPVLSFFMTLKMATKIPRITKILMVLFNWFDFLRRGIYSLLYMIFPAFFILASGIDSINFKALSSSSSFYSSCCS